MPKPSDTHHQPETEYIGELQQFTGTALPPDDPTLEPRERRDRPSDKTRQSRDETDTYSAE